jgi:predicted extracellular nuclease
MAEIFISEYIEGSSNNKAIEFYNPTGVAIDLGAGNYQLEIYFNGNTTPNTTINLSGTIAPDDVFWLADIDAVLGITPDQTNGSNFFNGDDAVVLKKNGTIIDRANWI